ncbi:MAG: hypothetical protein BWY63_00684 [Chloroflexi bacterium ADurb.Bin360]|nr:MAG: hypothetical protein BWY63_00684 [Chloroflexi bacterium ADurb.Bin360]
MLKVRHQSANSFRAQRINCISPPTGGRDIVRFVHNQEIETTGIHQLTLGRQLLAKQTQRTITLEKINGRNQPRKMRPRVDVNASVATELLHQLAIYDAKLKTELIAHLIAPLNLQRRRAHN